MRARSLTLSALAAVSLLSMTLVTSLTSASAQTTLGNVAKLELQNADARQAIRDLFKNSGPGRSFTIDPSIQGTVTLRLENIPFDTALQNIVRQVDASVAVEGGVYVIAPQAPGQAGPRPGLGGGGFGGGGFGGGLAQGGFGGNEPPVMTIDGEFLFVLRHGMLYKVDKKAMKVVGQVAVGPMGGGFGGGRPGGPGSGGFGGGGLGGGGNGQPSPARDR